MNNNREDIYEQTENDEFDDEKNDKELVLEILMFSSIVLQYMTENILNDK